MLCSISNLEQETINTIQTLEKELGKTLIAFSCHDIETAQIDASELQKIQALEKNLSLSLVAVNS
jgi:hypothetical protein